jgi:predicted metalloprotease
MALFQDDIEEVGDVCRVRVFTRNGNESNFTHESLDVARSKAEAFKRGYRSGAIDAANAALATAT